MVRSVVLVEQHKALAYFSALPCASEWKFFLPRPSDEKLTRILLEKGHAPVEALAGDDKARRFIQQYNQVMDRMAQCNPHRLWWATDMASKNQFSSQLPALLEEFVAIVEVIKNADCERLIVIISDGIMASSLKKSFRKSGIAFAYSGNEPRRGIRMLVMRLRKMGAVCLNGFRIWKRSMQARSHGGLKPADAKPYYVIRTFVYDHSFAADGQYQDAFFGNALDAVKAKENILVFAYVLGDWRHCLEAIRKVSHVRIVPLEAFLSAKDILEAVREALWIKIRVKDVSFDGHDVGDIIRQILWRTFKGVQLWQFVHFWAVRNLCRQKAIEKFLMPYENYPWERMSALALRTYSPVTKIIAYQHTVVPPSYLNLFISQGERQARVLPDLVLTTGEEPRRIMAEFGQYQGFSLQPSCALRFEGILKSQTDSPRRRPLRRILMPLEGFFYVYPMVSYAIRQMAGKPLYELKIRTHPLMPWKKLEDKFKISIKHLRNVHISQHVPLQEDLQWADIVLYWSSTVAMEALMTGKPVVHFNRGLILSYDPLFACPYFKRNTGPTRILADICAQMDALSDEAWDKEKGQAWQYLASYFHPVTSANLAKFIL